MLRDIYYAFAIRKISSPVHNAHPLTKFLGLIIVIIASSLASLSFLLLLLLLTIGEVLIAKSTSRLCRITRALTIPTLIIGFFSYIVYGLIRTIEIVLRLFIVAFSVTLFMSTTSPTELAQAFEKIGLPTSLAIIPELALRLIPFMAIDAQDSINSLILRNEVKISKPLPKGLVKVLAAIILSAIKRAEILAEALMAKYLGYSKRRTIIYSFRITPYDAVQFIIKLSLLIVIIFKIVVI